MEAHTAEKMKGTNTELDAARSDSREEIKRVAEAYATRIWDDKDLNAIDELVHKQCVIHSLLGDFHGPGSMKQIVQAWLTGFPDLAVKNISFICEHDLVVVHWQASGSHQGEFKGVKPAGRCVSYAGVTIYRIRDAKIIEYWAYLDMLHILKQIS